MACVSQEMSNKCLKCSVTEILVHQKFWSRGPKFLENWSAGPLFSENLGLCVADSACQCNSLGLLQMRSELPRMPFVELLSCCVLFKKEGVKRVSSTRTNFYRGGPYLPGPKFLWQLCRLAMAIQLALHAHKNFQHSINCSGKMSLMCSACAVCCHAEQ